MNYVFKHSILLALLAVALAALAGFTGKIDAGISNVTNIFLSSRSSVLQELEALNGSEDFIHNTDKVDNIISTVTKLAKILQSRRFLSHQPVYFGIGLTLIALQVFKKYKIHFPSLFIYFFKCFFSQFIGAALTGYFHYVSK